MSLDEFFPILNTNDTKKKLTVGQDIINYLANPENSFNCEDIGGFIDGIVPWMQSSNFKVSQNGLDVMGYLIERLGYNFRVYLNTVIGPAIDRLGDTREIVREKSNGLILKLMEETVDPQTLFEKMSTAFTHKNGKVREEILALFVATINSHGPGSLTISKFLGHIVALLSDPTAPVRDAASFTLVEIYRHVGERVRADLQRKHNVPPAKLSSLMVKFDAMRTSGDMMPTATSATTTIDNGRPRTLLFIFN